MILVSADMSTQEWVDVNGRTIRLNADGLSIGNVEVAALPDPDRGPLAPDTPRVTSVMLDYAPGDDRTVLLFTGRSCWEVTSGDEMPVPRRLRTIIEDSQVASYWEGAAYAVTPVEKIGEMGRVIVPASVGAMAQQIVSLADGTMTLATALGIAYEHILACAAIYDDFGYGTRLADAIRTTVLTEENLPAPKPVSRLNPAGVRGPVASRPLLMASGGLATRDITRPTH